MSFVVAWMPMIHTATFVIKRICIRWFLSVFSTLSTTMEHLYLSFAEVYGSLDRAYKQIEEEVIFGLSSNYLFCCRRDQLGQVVYHLEQMFAEPETTELWEPQGDDLKALVEFFQPRCRTLKRRLEINGVRVAYTINIKLVSVFCFHFLSLPLFNQNVFLFFLSVGCRCTSWGRRRTKCPRSVRRTLWFPRTWPHAPTQTVWCTPRTQCKIDIT